MNSKSEISRVNTQLANASRKKVASIDPIVQKALSEDPSCYDYDGTYDDFKAKEQVSHKLSQPSDNTAPVSSYYIMINFLDFYFYKYSYNFSLK